MQDNHNLHKVYKTNPIIKPIFCIFFEEAHVIILHHLKCLIFLAQYQNEIPILEFHILLTETI